MMCNLKTVLFVNLMHHDESMARRDKTRDREILGAEISLANSALVRIKSRVLTVSKMR